MSDKDGFELDVEETADEEFDDVNLDEGMDAAPESAPKKKKSGGGLVIFVLLLAILGGGSFAAVKFLGVQLPFDVPGLTTQQTAQAPRPAASQQPPSQVSAVADLPAESMPPQPVADAFANPSGLPQGISSGEPQEEVTISAPWEAGEIPAEQVAAAGEAAVPVEPFAADQDAAADKGNIVDPFAFGQQDVTAEVNAQPSAAPAASPEAVEIVDPFASMTAAPSPAPAAAAVTDAPAPAEDAAAKAKNAALEKKLAETQKALEASEKALGKANDDLAKKSEELAKAQADLKAAQKAAKSAESKPAAAPASSAAKPAAEQTAKPAVKTPVKAAAPVRKIEWVLRSAKPGMAWVSEKGSNEMRTVGVGDTLAGIGKVTAITTDAQGRWVVNGTRGSINQ